MTTAKTVKASEVLASAANTPAKPEVTLLFQQSELYKTDKELLNAMDIALKTSTEVMREYQKIALSAIVHIMQHGQIATIRKLYDKFPEGMRKDALGAYFDKYAPVSFDKQDNPETGKAELVINFSKEKRDEMKKSGWYAQAATNWWYKAAKQAEYKGFDFMEQFQRFVMQAKKKAENPKEGDNVSLLQVEALVKVMDDLHRQSQATVAQAA